MLKNIFKKSREENFIVIYILTNLTMNVEANQIMIQSIEKYNPTYWNLFNPEGYIVYFLYNDKNLNLSESLYKEFSSLIVEDNRFSDYKIGISEGPMIGKFSLKGKLISEPLGITENIAMQNLKGKSEF